MPWKVKETMGAGRRIHWELYWGEKKVAGGYAKTKAEVRSMVAEAKKEVNVGES